MELTRNLYRLDEVMAACMFCLTNGRVKEAAFWTAELILSDRAQEAMYCQVYAWAFTIGPLRLEWYRRAWEVFRRDTVCDVDIVQFAIALAGSITSKSKAEEFTNTKDTTALLLLLGSNYIETNFFKKWKSAEQEGWKGLEKRAGADGRMRQLLYGLQDIDSIVGGGDYSENLRRILFAIGYLGLLIEKEQKGESWRPLVIRDLDEEILGWLKPVEGCRRARRVYEIPYMCLYGMTERGKLPQNQDTLSEIRTSIEKALVEGGGWWKEYIEMKYPSLLDIDGEEYDETRERFFDTEFPDDIPDEWSLVDQKKSHGGGAGIGSTGEVQFTRLIERWYSFERSLWLGVKEGLETWKQVKRRAQETNLKLEDELKGRV